MFLLVIIPSDPIRQGSQRSGKTWKTWKRGCFVKKSGKTWKSQGIFVKFHESQGIFFQNALNLMVFRQPWWALKIIVITTKISTRDNYKTGRSALEGPNNFFTTK